MKVIYHLNSSDLAGVPSEAAWAEAMGYDGVATSETAHDPFLPLTLAATGTSRVTLDTRVAIAFPRSPMVLAYTARDLQDLSGGRFRLGLGTQVKGHIERRYSTDWDFARATAQRVHTVPANNLGCLGIGRASIVCR